MEVRFQRSLLPIITITISRRRHLDDDFENNSLIINKAEQQRGGQNFDQLTFFSFFSKKKRWCSIGFVFFVKNSFFRSVCYIFYEGTQQTERRTRTRIKQ
jgi:hypothetical protein